MTIQLAIHADSEGAELEKSRLATADGVPSRSWNDYPMHALLHMCWMTSYTRCHSHRGSVDMTGRPVVGQPEGPEAL